MFKKNGTQYITSLIKEGIADGTRTATVTGKWEIESAILIPSNFTLVLENCHLRMASGSFDNMIRNENAGDVLTRTAGKGDNNIRIKGVGEAILDGGEYNGLSERNAGKEGRPCIYVNNLLLFVNVNGFEVTDIHCRYQRWWALDFIYCSDGVIKNIDFLADDRGIDQYGNIYRGLVRARKFEPIIRNADGIDIRHGCHDIKIENITGFTEDDTVALTAVKTINKMAFEVDGKPLDICNIEVKNVRSEAFCSNVRLLSQGGIPVHDILIDGVYDMSENSSHMDRGGYGVRLGDADDMYGLRHATEDEFYNITVRNVRSRATDAALHLGGKMKNIVLENIEPFDGTKYMVDKRT